MARRHAAGGSGRRPGVWKTIGLLRPEPVVLEAPYRRTIVPSHLPDRRDDIVNASLGVKLTAVQGLTVIANGQWPLNRGGLRANAIWTAGLEYNF